MFKFGPNVNYFLYTKFADFRCGINKLCLKLQEADYEIDLYNRNVYIFICKKKDKIKLLFWDRDGFWLFHHQLIESKYKRIKSQNSIETITAKQLGWLLDGLDLNPKSYHAEISPKKII